ncbi:MAG: DHHW family protein [Clostridiaceae bacterium]|nr:DHHW family protein [Clostridiaceae bacterium]
MKKDHQAMIAFFLIPLYLLTVLNIFWPNQQVSADENRTLAQMPSFSWPKLASGEWTQEFENYFSDQFPMRNFFINSNQRLNEMVKLSIGDSVDLVQNPGGDEQDLGVGEHLEHDPGDLVTLSSQQTDPASSQTSPASENTQPTAAETNATATPTPESTTAVAPSVDGPVEQVSGVIIVDNRAMELYSFSESRSQRYVDLVNKLQTKLPNSQVYDMVAPTSVEFYSPEKYHSLSSSQKNAIQTIYSKMGNGIKTVDAYSKIVPHWEEYIYFRTDHHWTARGAYYAYQAFSESAGFTSIAMDQFQTGTIDGDFLGSLYRYTKSTKLKDNPDHVEYFMPLVSSEGVAFTSTDMTEGYKVQAVRTDISSTNKYLAFIQGDNPLVQFKTSLTNGRKIVVLKESFGNALVPYLTNHYQEVYVIDPRSLTADLPAFIQSHGIQDVLIINYAFSITNTKWLDGFEKMIG